MLKPQKIQTSKKETTLSWEGTDFKVWYNAAGYTTALEARAHQDLEGDVKSRYFATMLAAILQDWEVGNSKEEHYPTTVEALSELPLNFLSYVLNALVEKILPNETSSAASGSGSSTGRDGRGATFLDGTEPSRALATSG